MELSPPWEVANCSVTQDFPKVLRNSKVYYRAQNIPPLAPCPEPDEASPYHLILFL
jgi:hypothetical protein